MTNETESFMEYTKNKKKRNRKPLNPERERIVEEAYKRDMDIDEQIDDVIDYLELKADTPLTGIRARQQLMKKCVIYTAKWKTGTYKEWLNRLSLKLGLSPRTTRERYLNLLIEEGIVRENADGDLVFVGVPNKGKERV